MTSENGSSYSVTSLPVFASSQLSDLSLCLLPWLEMMVVVVTVFSVSLT